MYLSSDAANAIRSRHARAVGPSGADRMAAPRTGI
jgi:hypothetical protein